LDSLIEASADDCLNSPGYLIEAGLLSFYVKVLCFWLVSVRDRVSNFVTSVDLLEHLIFAPSG